MLESIWRRRGSVAWSGLPPARPQVLHAASSPAIGMLRFPSLLPKKIFARQFQASLFSPARSAHAFLRGPKFNVGELVPPQRPRFALPVLLSCKNKSMHREEPLSGRGSIALSRVNFRTMGLIAHAPRGKKRRLASSEYPPTPGFRPLTVPRTC